MPATNATIRPVRDGDEAAIAAIYAPHVTQGVASFEMTPPDSAEMAARIAATTPAYPWLVCDLPGQGVAGYVYASAFNPPTSHQRSNL